MLIGLFPVIIYASAIQDSNIGESSTDVAYATIDEISTSTIEPTTITPTTIEATTTENIQVEKVDNEIIVVNYVEEETEAPVPTPINEPSEYELDLLARTIYQEAGTCGEYCQWLVGSSVLNLADERGGLEAVVFDYNTFNVAYSLYNATPSDLSYSVASRLLSGDRDYSVKAFRTSYYHNFGTPYASVDNVYFSTY